MLPFLSPIWHWLHTGLNQELTVSAPPVIPYHGAGPPPIARKPHCYVSMLFKQPEDLEKQKLKCARLEGEPFPMIGRLWYDFERFVAEAGLGEIVTANWFEAL